MGMLADVLLLVWLTVSTWWLWRRGPARTLHTLTGAIIAYTAAFLAAVLTDLVVRGFGPNLWMRMLVDTLAGSLAFGAIWWRWNRAAAERREQWARVLDQKRWLLPGRLLIISGWLITQVVIVTVLINVLAFAWPPSQPFWQSSILARHLLGSARPNEHDAATAEQQRDLMNLRSGFTQSVDRLLDATGTRRAMAIMDALAWIANLDSETLDQMVMAEPALQHLINEPQLQAVIHDPRLMAIVDEATTGSLSAVYALGGEPAIQALVESPRMREALATIDPVALRARHSGAQVDTDDVPVPWMMTSMTSSLDLDARLADAAAWTTAPQQPLVQWPEHERYGVIRTSITVANSATLVITTDASVSCWVDDQLVRLSSQRALQSDVNSREHIITSGIRNVVILFDFGGVNTPAAAEVRVIPTAATGY